MKTQQDLTAQRLDELNVVNFAELPLKDAIRTVRGDGSRILAVFSDPDCPYCKTLEQELIKMDNVTIYTFLFPLDGLHPDASKKAKLIWCSTDKSAAWRDYMLHDKPPATGKNCDSPIDRNVQLGQKLNFNGTPTLVAPDGRVLPGAAPVEKIEKWLTGKGGN
jgi:thiol:disulfide interchange protein DsbC